MKLPEPKHELFIRANEGSLEVGCSCGQFLLDRGPGSSGFAQVSVPEITVLVASHYAQVTHPEKSNGSVKLIKGRK